MGSSYDFHIHTHHLKCANDTMQVPDILARCAALGLETIAITDHLNAPQFLPKHLLIKEELAAAESDLEIYFGVEVNVIDSQTGAVSIDQAQFDEAGFEVVIGGVHSSYHQEPQPRSIIDLQQKLMLAVVANPLVDVLVHPWWFGRREFEPGGPMEWFTSMDAIPEGYARELGEAAVAHNTAIEANWAAIWANSTYPDRFKEQYTEYIVTIADTGAKISIGSDAHDISKLDGVHPAADLLASRGITGDRLWRPAPRE